MVSMEKSKFRRESFLSSYLLFSPVNHRKRVPEVITVNSKSSVRCSLPQFKPQSLRHDTGRNGRGFKMRGVQAPDVCVGEYTIVGGLIQHRFRSSTLLVSPLFVCPIVREIQKLPKLCALAKTVRKNIIQNSKKEGRNKGYPSNIRQRKTILLRLFLRINTSILCK